MISNKEIFIAGSSKPFSIKQTETILNQMKKSVCKICIGDKKGTGFFCKIPYLGQYLTVLITSNHVFDKNNYNNSKEITISCFNDQNIMNIDLTKKRNYLFSKKHDTTILELHQNEVKDVDFLELNDIIFGAIVKLFQEIPYILFNI